MSTQEEDKVDQNASTLNDHEIVSRMANLLNVSEKEKQQIEEEVKKVHKFWDNQPVPKIYERVEESQVGPLEVKTLDQVQATPLDLPETFEWYDFDVDSDEDMEKVYNLLEQNYVEDDDAMFRFAYPVNFLRWALKPPKWRREWHIAVRVKSTGVFVGCITAVPAHIIVNKEKDMPMVEINFLCVHKKLREKRLAPKLIAEVTRRVNLTNVWQAVYTAGILLPKPVAKTRYYHRSLNPTKLIDIRFSSVPIKFRKYADAMKRTEIHFSLPEKPVNAGFRKMVKKDVPQVLALVTEYMKKFKLAPKFTKSEFMHWFCTKDGVIHSFVIEDVTTKEITDFASFYALPSTIIGHPKHNLLKAAYLYFYVAKKTPLQSLINDLLISAKKLDFDVFNCLDIMDNLTFIEPLKFGPGDGNLYYYLYNYKCPDLQPKHIGLTML